MAALPTQSAAQTAPNTNMLRPCGASALYTGDLTLMATLETAGEPLVR